MESIEMLEYWTRQRGIINGLKDYYPRLLKERHDLQVAINMIARGERLAKSIITEIMEEHNDRKN